jgi:hypothetical protein
MSQKTLAASSALTLLALLVFVAPASCDTIVLKDGSTFDFAIAQVDGGNRTFKVVNADRSVDIRASEIESVAFDESFDTLTLRDGSVYSNAIQVTGFDGGTDEFTIRRSGNVIDVRISEIKTIEFDTGTFDETGIIAPSGVLPPPEVYEVLPPLPAVDNSAEEEAPAALVENEAVQEAADKVGDFASQGAEEVGIFSSAEEWETPDLSTGAWDDWSDDALFSKLPPRIKRAIEPPAVGVTSGDVPQPYLPRWKGGGASKATSEKGARTASGESSEPRAASGGSTKARRPSGSKARSGSAPPSDKAVAEGEESSRSNRSSRSSRSNRSSRSSRSQGSSSRSGDRSSNFGGSNFDRSGGNYGSENYGSSGDRGYGGNYGSSGGNYGSGGYGGSGGGSRYGGGGYGY